MQIIGDLFNLILLQPALNLLVFIIRVLEVSHIPYPLGLSIIALTILIKLVVWPFASAQIRASKKLAQKTAELKPHLAELKKKHKDDKVAYMQAQKELYSQHGVNPAGGCLPAIVPILFIYPLYQVIQAFLDPQHGLEKINYFLYFDNWHLDRLPDSHFLGINLASKPTEFASAGFVLILIPLITAALQFLLSKMMAPEKPLQVYPKDTPKEKKEKESMEDSMMQMQSQMMYFLPIMIGFFSFTFPVGLSLYWNVLNIMTLFQQYHVAGWGALSPWIKRLKP